MLINVTRTTAQALRYRIFSRTNRISGFSFTSANRTHRYPEALYHRLLGFADEFAAWNWRGDSQGLCDFAERLQVRLVGFGLQTRNLSLDLSKLTRGILWLLKYGLN